MHGVVLHLHLHHIPGHNLNCFFKSHRWQRDWGQTPDPCATAVQPSTASVPGAYPASGHGVQRQAGDRGWTVGLPSFLRLQYLLFASSFFRLQYLLFASSFLRLQYLLFASRTPPPYLKVSERTNNRSSSRTPSHSCTTARNHNHTHSHTRAHTHSSRTQVHPRS